MQKGHRDPRVGLVLVGFSPADRLAPIAGKLGWTGLVLGDQDRALYRRLGLGRARWWRVYNPGTLAVYGRVLLRGRAPSRPREDTRQLGGDAVLAGGFVVALWRPRSPDGRPPAGEVLLTATEVADGLGTAG